MLAHKASLIKKKSVLISVAKHPRHLRSKIIVNFMRFIVFIVIVEMLGSMTD